MPRFKLTIEYDGGPFVGWQRQDTGISVQSALEEAIFRFSGERAAATAAGRTDAGVHALGQVAHIDLDRPREADTVRDAINFYLKPLPVAILQAEEVAGDFHARFSARARAYVYRIVCRRAPVAVDAGRVWWVRVALDAGAMAEGAKRLLGTHDFTSFRASVCQSASPVKTLDRLDVVREGNEIHIYAGARSFLHHQVRNMVGTLKWVGEGKWTPDDVTRALEARARAQAGPTAPAEGLYLTAVTYP